MKFWLFALSLELSYCLFNSPPPYCHGGLAHVAFPVTTLPKLLSLPPEHHVQCDRLSLRLSEA